MIETVRVSESGRDQLIALKRHTKIKNWNVLCRWAFCISLAEKTPPSLQPLGPDSSIEMTWRVFAGEYTDLYWALLKQRCRSDNLSLDDATLSQQFKAHLHRGIGYLLGDRDLRSIDVLVQRIG